MACASTGASPRRSARARYSARTRYSARRATRTRDASTPSRATRSAFRGLPAGARGRTTRSAVASLVARTPVGLRVIATSAADHDQERKTDSERSANPRRTHTDLPHNFEFPSLCQLSLPCYLRLKAGHPRNRSRLCAIIRPSLKILQLASYYAPVIGGMETVLQDLAEGLLAAGDQVTVLCASSSRRGADEIMTGVRVLRSPSLGKLLSQPLTPFLPATLRRLHRAHDLVHLHMPNPLAEAAAAALPRAVRLVVTYHADVIRQKALKPLYGPVRRAVLARSRRIVVPTENHIRYSEVLPAFADKCAVVPFGISRARYRMTEASRVRAAELRARHGRFVLFVGRLVYYKGLPQLIESMQKVDGTLVIVGDGPLRREVESKVASLQLGGRISLAGAVSQTELNAHLEACELLVLPSVSRSEGFGMTQLEAMLFGKPLVTTRLPSGVQMVNEDGHTGLQVPPGDSAALAAALNRLLADGALRTAMGAAARERVASRFSLEQMVRGYRDVYRQALS